MCNFARVWKMEFKGSYLSSLILIISIINLGDASRLSRVNNTTIIKSIKSEDGDVIDCVDISHQPAFDHPLLKDHTIEMKPSYHPEGLFTKSNLSKFESSGNKNQITQLWQLSGECPQGTIPIRRTEKRKNSLTKKHRNLPGSSPSAGHEYAVTYTGDGNYYGAKATISAWNPYVERDNEFSLSQIWVLGGSGSDLNTIEVGWIVNPMVFGDYRTRLFVYWTSDDYQSTGCWNLVCSGFVQITNSLVIGGSIATADDNGPEISLLVWKDVRQRVWWLQYNGIVVGYWPTTLFTVLNGSASLIEWGGEIINSNIDGKHTATYMGSGHFAEKGFGSSSYFRNLLVVNSRNTLVPPPSIGGIATNPPCYSIAVRKSNNWGNFFYYGGPGRNPDCP